MPHNQEVIGSNPAELFSSLSILRSMFVFLVPLGGGAAQLIFLCNKCLAAHLVAKRGLWANNLQKTMLPYSAMEPQLLRHFAENMPLYV